MAETAPYGTWKSPISASDVARHDGRPGWVGRVGDETWWTAPRPTEGGRVALLRRRSDGSVRTLLDEPWNVRTRVIEYGGKCWDAVPGPAGPTVVFAEWSDQRLYRFEPDRPGSAPEPITPEPAFEAQLRHVEPLLRPDRGEVWCVRENFHGRAATDLRREIVAVPLDGSAAADPRKVRVLAASHHFMSCVRLSPSGNRVAWLGWDHPSMPWDGTYLCCADVDSAGGIGDARVLAGGPDESVVQVEWLGDDSLVFLSDASGWWNPHRIAADGTGRVGLCDRAEEFGGPMWQLGQRWMAPLGDGRVAVIHGRETTALSVLDPAGGSLTPVASAAGAYTEWAPTLAVHGNTITGVAASPTTGYEVVQADIERDEVSVLAPSHHDAATAEFLPPVKFTTFTGRDGREIHTNCYAPHNPEFAAPAAELPPYAVFVHGGPTSRSPAVHDLEVAYFTSRGIGVVEVNYGGSTGHGREYRNRLRENWGIVDVEDCADVAKALAEQGIADPDRLTIRGGSAGGWTTAASLTKTASGAEIYRCGTILYPIVDLSGWAEDETHDFESRYLESLIGPWPETEERYRERSPANRVEQLTTPFLLLQGLEDEICPPSQSERFLERVAGRDIPHAYIAFEGEQHGFRRESTIVTALEAELGFYGQVLGFSPQDAVPIELRS